jgi:hypothetical protein
MRWRNDLPRAADSAFRSPGVGGDDSGLRGGDGCVIRTAHDEDSGGHGGSADSVMRGNTQDDCGEE